MIRTVIFDIDDTLYSYKNAHAAAFTALQDYAEKNVGIPKDTFVKLHKEMNGEIKDRLGSCAAIHNRLIRYQNILEQQGKPVYHALKMNDLYWDTLLAYARPTEGAESTMKALKAKGIRIGIGSDMTARLQFVKLEKLDLIGYVDFIVTSEEAGAEKPSAKMFELCLEKSGCKSGECIFIGDSLSKDAEGPTDFGMKGIWFNPEGKSGETEVPVISKLEEILTLLD